MAGQALQPPAPGPRVPERPTERRRKRASISGSNLGSRRNPGLRSRSRTGVPRTRRTQSRVRGATRTFGYWHIRPAVRNQQQVRLHQLLGHVLRGGLHVHFAERDKGDYVNPLRPGGIGPYVDRTPSTVVIGRVLAQRADSTPEGPDGPDRHHRRGLRHDPLVVPEPWSQLPVTPALIRWSLSYGARSVIRSADGGRLQPAAGAGAYDWVYARVPQETLGPSRPLPFLSRTRLSRLALPAGVGRLRIEAADTRGNRVVAEGGDRQAARR